MAEDRKVGRFEPLTKRKGGPAQPLPPGPSADARVAHALEHVAGRLDDVCDRLDAIIAALRSRSPRTGG